MTNFGNELFLLMVNLSQYKKESTILRIFNESLIDLYPHLNISLSKDESGDSLHDIEISTSEYHFGYLKLQKEPTREELAQLENATQMTGLILQNLRQQQLLDNEKRLLKDKLEKRKRELEQSESKYRRLYQTMAEGVVYQDAEGKITSANPAAERIIGLNLDQMQGRTSMDPEWKAIRQDGKELKGEEHPAMVALRTGKKVENFTLGIYNPQREDYIWIIVNSIPLFTENRNNQKYVYSTLLDITEKIKAEKKVKENEEKLKNIIDYSNNLFYSHSTDYKITYVSKQSYHFFGCSPEEAKKRWTEFLTDNPINKIGIELTQKAINTGKEQPPYELEILKKTGEIIWVEVYEKPVIKKGKVTSLVGALIDITERKKAEQKIKESEERFKALFHKNSAVFLIVDPETGKIYDANQRASEFYGYKLNQLRGKPIKDINVLPKKQLSDELFKAKKEEKDYFTFTHRLANGEFKDVEIFTGKININNKEYIYSTIHDITEQTRNRKRLQKGEQIAKIGHWEIDLKKKKVYSSQGARKIYGITEEDLTIEDIQKIPLEEYRPILDKALKDLIEKDEPYNVEFKIQRPSDRKIADIQSIAEYQKDRNIVFGIIQDISDRKEFEKELKQKNEELQATEEELRVSNEELWDINQRLEEQKRELEEAKEKAEESDRLKSAFLANMSHEIRTPMNGIMGFSQMLQEKEFPRDQQKEFLNIIHSRTQHLLRLINEIVDISKIETEQLTLNYQEFNLNEVLYELYDIYKAELKTANKAKIDLKLTAEFENENSTINSDVSRLRQVVENLLNNAIKFTDDGEIEFGYNLLSGNQLLFYIKDTGIGISEKDQDCIFERFRQLDDASTRIYEGTGLGLTISKYLAELLGGEMWVESEKGKGSVFYFTLPYKRIQDAEEYEGYETNEEHPEWNDKKIMVVEDDPTSLEYMKAILKPTGADLILKETGQEGLRAFQNNPDLDIVLMDIRLPDINGMEVIKEIRKHNNEIPIIAQTAHAMGEDRHKCLNAGADNYIAKPIDKDNLFALLVKYI